MSDKVFQIGDQVKFKVGRGSGQGKIVDIYLDDGSIVIQTDKGKKVIRTAEKVEKFQAE